MRGIKKFILLNNIPLLFLACYLFISFVINLDLGANPKHKIFPILLLIISFILTFFSSEKFLLKNFRLNFTIFVDIVLLINIVFFVTGKFNVESQFFKNFYQGFGINLKLLIIALSLFLFLAKFYFRNKNLLILSFIFTTIIFISSIFTIPRLYQEPFIDLYIILKNSIISLNHDLDPYGIIYSDIYNGNYDYAYQKQDIKLVYWPMNLYLVYPSHFLFGDLRYAYIISLITSCLILYFGYKNKTILYASIILLFSNSYSFYMVKYAWIDSLAFPFFALFFVLFDKKKYFLSFFIVGIIMSLKLYFIVLFPISIIYFYNIEKNIKKSTHLATISLITFVLCFMPYIFTNADAIFYTLEFFAKSFPRYDSLSIPGFVFKFGYNIDKICTAISFSFILWILYKIYKNKKKTTLSLIRYLCVILFTTFILSKQAFGNYYYNLIFLSVVYFCFVIVSNEKNQKNIS